MKKTIPIVIIISFILPCLPAFAEPLRQLSWNDLVPAHLLEEDPLADLTGEQVDLVFWVVNTLDSLPERGLDTEEFYQEVDQAIPQLRKAGIDITELMAKRKILQTSVVNTFNGQRVRIPGYLLPLEVSATAVSEFLLVPYVGACIHVPPPPPNQVIYVKLINNNRFKSNDLYTPIWVTGIISAKSLVKNLYLADGADDINVGYTMQANRVEPYKE